MILGLLTDPSSRVHAAVSGWEYPISREGMLQLEQIDLLLMRWMKKGTFRAVGRPWDRARVQRNAARLNDEALHRKLRPHLYK